MKRIYLIIVMGLMTACSFFSATQTPTMPAAATVAPAAPTAQPATETPPVEASPTAEPTPIPLPPVISALNAQRLGVVMQMTNPDTRKVVFSTDGSQFAATSGNQSNFALRVWNTDDGSLARSFDSYSGIVWDAAFSPEGTMIASASDDANLQGVKVWRVADGALVQALNQPPTANSLAYSPDGKVLAVGGIEGWPNGVIWLYDTVTWQSLGKLELANQNVLSLSFSSDGSTLISSGSNGEVKLWRLSDQTLIHTFFRAAQASKAVMSPDMRWIAANFCEKSGAMGCERGGLTVWETANLTLVQEFEDVSNSMAFSPDGKLLTSGAIASGSAIWLRTTGDWSLVGTLAGQASSLTFSPDGFWIAATDLNGVTIWGVQ